MRSRRATRPVDYQALAGNKGGVWSDSDDDRSAHVRSPVSVDMALHRTLPPIRARPKGAQPPRPMSAHAMYAGPNRHRSPAPGYHTRAPISPVSAKHSEAAATLVDLFYSLPAEASVQGGGQQSLVPHLDQGGQRGQQTSVPHLDLDAAWYTPHGLPGPSNASAAPPPRVTPTKRPREEDLHTVSVSPCVLPGIVCSQDALHRSHPCSPHAAPLEHRPPLTSCCSGSLTKSLPGRRRSTLPQTCRRRWPTAITRC